MTMGLRMGPEMFYQYFSDYHLLEKTGIDIPGEAGTIMHNLDNIGEVELATMTFGQSFQITPVQLATMVSSVVNGQAGDASFRSGGPGSGRKCAAGVFL